MFDQPSESRIPQPAFNEFVARLEDNARKIGLYLGGVSVGVMESPVEGDEGTADMPVVCLVRIAFQVGDIAFSTRVQNPEEDAINDEMRAFEKHISDDTLNELRLQLQRDQDEGRDSE